MTPWERFYYWASPWVSSVVGAIKSPEWFADLTQSFLGAAAALFGALWILRRQLSHDRELLNAQLAASENERSASRNAVAGDILGRALIDAANSTDILDTDEFIKLLTADGDSGSRAPGEHTIYDAYNTASFVLDLDEKVILGLWLDRKRIWRAGRKLASEVGSRSDLANVDWQVVLHNTVDSQLNNNRNTLRRLGIAYCRWDGRYPLPIVAESQPRMANMKARVPVSKLRSRIEQRRLRDQQAISDTRAEFERLLSYERKRDARRS